MNVKSKTSRKASHSIKVNSILFHYHQRRSNSVDMMERGSGSSCGASSPRANQCNYDQYKSISPRSSPLPNISHFARRDSIATADLDETTKPSYLEDFRRSPYADLYDLAAMLDIKNGDATLADFKKDRPQKGFSIFEAFLEHADLLLCLGAHLAIPDLVSLYCISRTFHFHFNLHYATYVLQSAREQAPESYRIFPFRQHRDLHLRDPAGREDPDNPGQIRINPSLCWLQMLHYREVATNDIIVRLGLCGHRLPRRASITIKKIWLLMDMPTTATRVGLMHNANLWTKEDLLVATMFFIKLDMRFSHPVEGCGDTALRELLLCQRGLTMLWKTLRGESLQNKLQILQQYARCYYRPPTDIPNLQSYPIMGIPAREVGKYCYEFWGKTGSDTKLLRPDQLVIGESARRNLMMGQRLLGLMFYGYVNPKTGRAIELNIVDSLQKSRDDEERKQEEEVKRLVLDS